MEEKHDVRLKAVSETDLKLLNPIFSTKIPKKNSSFDKLFIGLEINLQSTETILNFNTIF